MLNATRPNFNGRVKCAPKLRKYHLIIKIQKKKWYSEPSHAAARMVLSWFWPNLYTILSQRRIITTKQSSTQPHQGHTFVFFVEFTSETTTTTGTSVVGSCCHLKSSIYVTIIESHLCITQPISEFVGFLSNNVQNKKSIFLHVMLEQYCSRKKYCIGSK